MKLSVGLKVANSLSLTPQLQQAIKLLQLSALELEQEIQLQLDSNPLLEKVEEQSSIESLSNLQEQEMEKKQIGTGIVLHSIPIPALNLFVLQCITTYYIMYLGVLLDLLFENLLSPKLWRVLQGLSPLEICCYLRFYQLQPNLLTEAF